MSMGGQYRTDLVSSFAFTLFGKCFGFVWIKCILWMLYSLNIRPS